MNEATQAALDALEKWLQSPRQTFRANGELLLSADGEKYFISQSDCQELADHGKTIRQALVNAEKVPELIAAIKAAYPFIVYEDNLTCITKNRHLLEVADKMQKALAAFNAGRDEGKTT